MRSNIAVAAILLALASYVFFAAGALPFGTMRVPQTAFFPKVLGTVLFVLSLLLLAQSLAGAETLLNSESITPGGWTRIGATLAALGGFAVILERLGFLLTTFLLMVILLRAIEAQSWGKVMALAFATSLITYGIFARLLGVPLPSGFLGI